MEIHIKTENPFVSDNQLAILRALWQGDDTLASITKVTGLSKPTIKYNIDKLRERDIIRKKRGTQTYEAVSSDEKLFTIREARLMLAIVARKLDIQVMLIRWKNNTMEETQ